MLLPESLHLSDCFSLVDNEFLVPHGSESLKLTPVLLLYLHLFACVLIDERMLETRLSLLSYLHNTLKLHLGLAKIALPLIN